MQKTEDKHIHYSVSIINNTNANSPIPANFTETRTNPIITNSNEYHISVVRFSVPMATFPISYFKIEQGIGQTDPNRGIWKMKIRNSSTSVEFELNVQYIYSNGAVQTPVPPSQNNGIQVVSSYYFVYSYTDICEMFNSTLVSLYALAGIFVNIPRFVFEAGIFSLVIHADFIPGQAGYNDWGDIYFNNSLVSQCLGALSYSWNNYDWFKLKTTGPIYYNVIQNPALSDAAAGGYDWLKISQNFTFAPQYLSFVRKIYITSSTLKARKLLTDTNNSNLASPNLPIIFTFEPDTTSPGIGRDSLFYFNPNWKTNNILDLLGKDAIYSLDLQVYVQDNYGETWPLLLEYGMSVEVQFLFSKKDSY